MLSSPSRQSPHPDGDPCLERRSSVDGALCRRHGIRARRQGPLFDRRYRSLCQFVRSPHYGDLLLGNRAYGAWVGSDMVGVVAWSMGEAPSPTARVVAVFVHPLFSRNGIGTRLTEYLEVEAVAAGYRALEISATLNAAGFFEQLGLSRRRDVAGVSRRDTRCRSPSCARCTAGAPTSCTDGDRQAARPRRRAFVRSRPISGNNSLIRVHPRAPSTPGVADGTAPALCGRSRPSGRRSRCPRSCRPRALQAAARPPCRSARDPRSAAASRR